MMKCMCCKQMHLVTCDDRNQQPQPDYCYNLYNCECGMILKDDIHNGKQIWININSEVATVNARIN
jgi:hypothetical protein